MAAPPLDVVTSPPAWRAPGPAAAALAVLAAVALAHGGALGHGFVHFDDDVYVYANPRVLAGPTLDGLRWAFRLGDGAAYFHPLTWLSLMAEAALFGGQALGFHLVSLLLHAASALLLLALLDRATGRPGPSLAAALLWAVHPLTVEAVAWATERKTVLATALGVGALVAWGWYARRPGWRRLAVVTGLLAAGLLAKPSLVTLPLVMLCLDGWPLGRGQGRATSTSTSTLLLEKWPLYLVALAALGLSLLSTGAIFQESTAARPLGLRVAHAVASLPTYLAAAAWPSGLAVFHPYPAAVSALELGLGAVFLLGLTGAALALRRGWPAGLAGWGWFLAALAPSLGLAQAGLWPGWAERFAYLPLQGLAIAVAFGAADLLARLGAPRLAGPLLAAAALAALVPATRHQVEAWRDSVTLFERAAAAEPLAPVLHFNLGVALLAAGRTAEAEPALAEAVRLAPRFPNAHAALGLAQARLGRPAEAAGHFLAALRDQPDHPEALFGYAEALRALGRGEQARALYLRFLAVAPPAMAAERTAAQAQAGGGP